MPGPSPAPFIAVTLPGPFIVWPGPRSAMSSSDCAQYEWQHSPCRGTVSAGVLFFFLRFVLLRARVPLPGPFSSPSSVFAFSAVAHSASVAGFLCWPLPWGRLLGESLFLS